MALSWRKELLDWSRQYAEALAQKPGILGVIIGGSLARGQEWRHSDMEIGVLVEERIQEMPYFNVDGGHGVEIIQIVRGDLEEQVCQVEGGDLKPILKWPIQLWKGRVISDPSGLLGRYKKQFDEGLFNQQVTGDKIAGLKTKIDQTLAEGRGLLAENKPAAALVKVRGAMNEAILAFHWSKGELPRSQNRTDSRLRLVSGRHNDPAFYALYREVFDLTDTGRVVRKTWPLVKEQVLEITRLWGDAAHDFFVFAVDSDFQWRQNAGILTVYRLYIPIIGSVEQNLIGKLDDVDWRMKNKDLLVFLGLSHADHEEVSALLERLAERCRQF